MNKLAKQLLPFSSLLFIISLWTFLEPDTFLTFQNFKNVLSSSAANGIIAAGMTFVIITAGIDLSVGSMLAMCGILGSIVMLVLSGANWTQISGGAAVELGGFSMLIGTLIGMAGGAIVGAAVGQAADEAHQKKVEQYEQRRMDRGSVQRQSDYDYPDDRIYMDNTPARTPDVLEIRRPMLIDSSRDQVLARGEEARIVFEVYNTTDKILYRVRPNVTEISGNKHIEVSDNVMIESIAPGKGIRYTALVRADNGLRDGEAVFRIGVFLGRNEIVSQTREFRIQTSKR